MLLRPSDTIYGTWVWDPVGEGAGQGLHRQCTRPQGTVFHFAPTNHLFSTLYYLILRFNGWVPTPTPLYERTLLYQAHFSSSLFSSSKKRSLPYYSLSSEDFSAIWHLNNLIALFEKIDFIFLPLFFLWELWSITHSRL